MGGEREGERGREREGEGGREREGERGRGGEREREREQNYAIINAISMNYSRKGKYYMIEGFDKNGCAYPPKVLKKQLEQVIEMAGGKSQRTGLHTSLW